MTTHDVPPEQLPLAPHLAPPAGGFVLVPHDVRDRAPDGPSLYLAARLYGLTRPGGEPPRPAHATLMRYLGRCREGEPPPDPRYVRMLTRRLDAAGLVQSYVVHPRRSRRYLLSVPPVRPEDGVGHGRVPRRLFQLVEDPTSPLKPDHVLSWLFLDQALGRDGWTLDTAAELAEAAAKARPGLRAPSARTFRRHVGHFAAGGLIEKAGGPGAGWALTRPGRRVPARDRVRPNSSGHRGQIVPVSAANGFRSLRPESSGPDQDPRTRPEIKNPGTTRPAGRDAAGGSAELGRAKRARRKVSGREISDVVSGLPPALRKALGGKVAFLPQPVVDEIDRQLRARSPAELRARALRRWQDRGYSIEAAQHAIEDPVALAVSLIAAEPCTHARCEAGLIIDTGTACPACAERGHDVKAKQRGRDAAYGEHGRLPRTSNVDPALTAQVLARLGPPADTRAWPGPGHTDQCGHGFSSCGKCPLCTRGIQEIDQDDPDSPRCVGCPPGGRP